MLERILGKKEFKYLVYILGIILELIGFALLFAFDKTMVLIHKWPILFSIIIILSGYVMAVAVRRRLI